MTAAVEAVAEVGNPTVVATLTVVAALLPMLFVSGLMGPYMAPIPANASAAMLFSFFVAVMVTPLAAARGPRRAVPGHGHADGVGALGRLTSGWRGRCWRARRNAWTFLIGRRRRRHPGRLFVLRPEMRDGQTAAVRQQVGGPVVVDLPRGASLEDTDRLLAEAARR